VSHPGGAETTLLRLLHGLARRGWAVTVAAPGDGLLRRQAAAAGFDVRRVDSGGLRRRRGARAILSWPRVRGLAFAADVVYLNGAVCGRLLPALAALRRRPRVVLHVHDIVGRVPRMWRAADVVLVPTQAVADRLVKLNPHVVHAPVDLDPPPAVPPWPPGAGPVIGFVGRVEASKGPLDLVRAAPAIKRGAPGARVVIVGEDAYGSSPRYAEAVIGSPEVEHYPWVTNAPGLMRHLDVLVLPSYREPFGTVLAEAMAVGTPVVASRVDGLPEVVQDGVTGRLVAPGDPGALAAAVLEVLGRRAEMGEAARRHAQRFATEDYVERVAELIAP
jgi:glycosyltransferase involved in cell wall biosynthesis